MSSKTRLDEGAPFENDRPHHLLELLILKLSSHLFEGKDLSVNFAT
jgi:hypothetical protein